MLLVSPAGMVTVSWLLVKPVTHTSVVEEGQTARVAPLLDAEATVTVTSVAAVRAEVVPAKAAVTVIVCVPEPSATEAGNTDSVMSSSSSTMVIVAGVASPNGEEPLTVIVSGPSTIASSVTVNPVRVAVAEGVALLAGKVMVLGVAGV